MKATIDSAGRSVVPKQLRDHLVCPRPRPTGADLRVRPVAEDAFQEQDGWLVVPAVGIRVTDDAVRDLRAADRR